MMLKVVVFNSMLTLTSDWRDQVAQCPGRGVMIVEVVKQCQVGPPIIPAPTLLHRLCNLLVCNFFIWIPMKLGLLMI